MLLRFERADGKNNGFGGEHISILHDKNNTLLGFANMTQEYSLQTVRFDLDDKKHAYKTVLKFLSEFAADLELNHPPAFSEINFDAPFHSISKDIDLHWIECHDDEQINIDASSQAVGGLKIKMRMKAFSNQWMWVILNQTGKVCVFERNICWEMNKLQRQTEKWLHDYEEPLTTDSQHIILTQGKYRDLFRDQSR